MNYGKSLPYTSSSMIEMDCISCEEYDEDGNDNNNVSVWRKLLFCRGLVETFFCANPLRCPSYLCLFRYRTITITAMVTMMVKSVSSKCAKKCTKCRDAARKTWQLTTQILPLVISFLPSCQSSRASQSRWESTLAQTQPPSCALGSSVFWRLLWVSTLSSFTADSDAPRLL